MTKNSILLILLLLSIQISAQIRFQDAEIKVLNNHVWRGVKLGSAPAIEPSLTLNSGRFSLNLWAAVTTNNSYSEFDIIPSWQFRHFQLTLFDYYNPVSGEKNQFLNFQEGKNRHSLELAIDNYSIDKKRIKWMLGTFVSGDRHSKTGDPQYSSYLEVKYPFTFCGIDTEPFIGFTPFKGYYAEHFAVINSGISFGKTLDFNVPFSIPISISFVSNPYTRNSFLIFALGIAI